ncbi:iron dependent repressor DNA binding domain protein [Coprococcus sp. CAG:782]|jgi:DtxR family Mn-dependent transcriptional regulator|nr:metal-dependent transcriptional regulator [Coprococcus sp.]CCY53350.1 iron dependent repressor DNA binding domain protein [Coprococcus sp. CAG:782]
MLITNESVENYLETILRLSEKLPVVRSVDIAEELGYKKSSISVAMKNLKNQEYITVSDRGYIQLTESGMGIARKIYERHDVISTWLVTLGVDPQVASDDACKLEHVLSDQTFNALKDHINGLR